ncbi:GntR family transcriptional regulator [Enterococcus faecium]|nr:GntR family transcriptional regulator [Enterococcus faecium]
MTSCHQKRIDQFYGVSRTTVRLALQELEKNGHLSTTWKRNLCFGIKDKCD